MLHGPIWDKILQFALPVAAIAILGQLFNAADIAVILFFGRPLIFIFNMICYRRRNQQAAEAP